MIRGWVRGEQERVIEIDARGASLELLLVSIQSEERSLLPNSCAWDLISLLPAPLNSGEVFASDTDGRLHRYSDGRWDEMGTPEGAPRVGVLLGFEAATSPLTMLVEDGDQDTLWNLTISGPEVTDAALAPVRDPAFSSRDRFLARYDVGRCHHGDQDCLYLHQSDDRRETRVYREPTPGEARTRVRTLARAVRDVAYVAGSDRSRIYALAEGECQ